MLIPDGYAQINAIHTGAGVPTGAQWTLGIDLVDFSGTPEILAKAFEDWLLASDLYSFVGSDVSMTSVLVKYGPNATGPSHLEPAAEPGNGGTGAAPNVAYLIHKNTDLGGRAGRGRFFLPGVPEANVNSNGLLASGIATGIDAALTTFRNELITSGVLPVVLHAEGSPVSTPTPITTFTADATAATQRRRLRR